MDGQLGGTPSVTTAPMMHGTSIPIGKTPSSDDDKATSANSSATDEHQYVPRDRPIWTEDGYHTEGIAYGSNLPPQSPMTDDSNSNTSSPHSDSTNDDQNSRDMASVSFSLDALVPESVQQP